MCMCIGLVIQMFDIGNVCGGTEADSMIEKNANEDGRQFSENSSRSRESVIFANGHVNCAYVSGYWK